MPVFVSGLLRMQTYLILIIFMLISEQKMNFRHSISLKAISSLVTVWSMMRMENRLVMTKITPFLMSRKLTQVRLGKLWAIPVKKLMTTWESMALKWKMSKSWFNIPTTRITRLLRIKIVNLWFQPLSTIVLKKKFSQKFHNAWLLEICLTLTLKTKHLQRPRKNYVMKTMNTITTQIISSMKMSEQTYEDITARLTNLFPL